jgi:AcrR family transcriptional regulator
MRVVAGKARGTARRFTDRGQAQKQRMVDAAYAIIAARGFEGLRTRDVAARAGLNISTFHYYFPSKEDLVRDVARRLLHEFKTASPDRQGNGGALSKLHEEFMDQSSVIRKHPETYVVLMELFTRSLRDASLRPIFSELLDVWEKHVKEYVDAGIDAGEIVGHDPDAVARALQCMLLGSAINLLSKRQAVPAEGVYREVARWLRKGLD